MRKVEFESITVLWVRIKNLKKLILAGLFLISLTTPVLAWEFTKALSLGYIRESNLTADEDEQWCVKDGANEAALNLGLEKEVKPGQRWSFSLELKDREQQSFSAYNRFSSRLRTSYRHKQGLGMLAPWWRIQAGVGKVRFQNEPSMSRNVTDLQVEIGKRLNPRTTLSGTLGYDQTRGTRTDVLNLEGVFGTIRGQYVLDSRWSLCRKLSTSSR